MRRKLIKVVACRGAEERRVRVEIKVLNIILKATVKRNFRNRVCVDRLRRDNVSFDKIRHVRGLVHERMTIGGIDVLRITRAGGNSSKLIIYLSGGAYVSGPSGNHISFAERLSSATGCEILIVRYRLAPEHGCADAHSDVSAVYDWAQSKFSDKEIIIAGDSAGGGLGLAFSMSLRESGRPLPSKLVLISPWLDVSLSNTGITAEADRADPVLSRSGMKDAGRMYAGSMPLDNYLVSPFFGQTGDLPPMLMISSSLDILVHDCRDFNRRCSETRTQIIYSEYSDVFHAWAIIPPYIQEVKQAFSEIVDFLQ
jgi:acetyl esterase/lipase